MAATPEIKSEGKTEIRSRSETDRELLDLAPDLVYIGPDDKAPTYEVMTSPYVPNSKSCKFPTHESHLIVTPEIKSPPPTYKELVTYMDSKWMEERNEMLTCQALVPLRRGDKIPLTATPWTTTVMVSHGKGRPKTEATVYNEEIRLKFDKYENYGFVTGKRNQCTVIDIDAKNGGMRFYALLCWQNKWPDTYWVRTGSGGVHLYFDYEPDLKTTSNTCSYDKKPIGIDVRNDNGYVVGEGSVHASGNLYLGCTQRPLKQYVTKEGKTCFPKMPDWIKKLATPGCEIIYVGDGLYDLRHPTDKVVDTPGGFINVTSELLVKLIKLCPPDIAFTTMSWRTGLRAINKITREHKIAKPYDIANIFAKRSIRDGVDTYCEESTNRAFGGKVRESDPGLNWFIKAARNCQSSQVGVLELETAVSEIRNVNIKTSYDQIDIAYKQGKTVEEIEDIMLGCIHQINRKVTPDWVIRYENEIVEIKGDAPFAGLSADHQYTPTSAISLMKPKEDGKEFTREEIAKFVSANTGSLVFKRLRSKIRFEMNTWRGTTCLFTFTHGQVAMPETKIRLFDTFMGFANYISADVEALLKEPEKKFVIENTVKRWSTSRTIGTPFPDVKTAEPSAEDEKAILATARAKTGLQFWLDHLLTELCSGDVRTYAHAIKFLAQMIQFPRIITGGALIFDGGQGIGKGWFWTIFSRFVIGRQHAGIERGVDGAAGSFNGLHDRKILMVMDECKTFSGDHAQADILKQLTGASEIVINKKGKDQYIIDNFVRYIFLTNNRSPIKMDHDDRRYCICEGKRDKAMPVSYHKFMEAAILTHPTYGKQLGQDIVDYLALVDIKDWDHTKIPNTPKRLETKEMSLPPGLRFMCDIARGKVPFIEQNSKVCRYGGIGINISQQELYEVYCAHSPGSKRDIRVFSSDLSAIGLSLTPTHDYKHNKCRCYSIRKDALRQALADHLKCTTDYFSKQDIEIVPEQEMEEETEEINIEHLVGKVRESTGIAQKLHSKLTDADADTLVTHTKLLEADTATKALYTKLLRADDATKAQIAKLLGLA